MVERGEGTPPQRLTLQLTPRDEGGVGRAGFEPARALRVTSPGARRGAGRGLPAGPTRIAWSQVTVFGKLFSGAKGTKLSGPIGIAQQLLRGGAGGGGRRS